MNKYSQLKAVWPLIYNKLKNPPPGIQLGDFPSKLPSMDKIILEDSATQPEALGYVSTEDANNNGIIDKIHIVVPKLEKYLQGITPQQIEQADPQTLYNILAPFVELISHEMGHQKDYKHNGENPFPGGESAADIAARDALSKVQLVQSKYNRSFDMKKKAEVLKKLVKLSSDLDNKGSHKLADQVMKIATDLAADLRKESQTAPVGSPQRMTDPLRDRSIGKTPMTAESPYSSLPDTKPIRDSQRPVVQSDWTSYASKSPKHEQVKYFWELASNKMPGYDKSFMSFVKWYNKTRPPGQHMSTTEVLRMLDAENKAPGAKVEVGKDFSMTNPSLQGGRLDAWGTPSLAPSADANDAYADLDAEDLVKNASVNSVFWYDTKKTPFGR